VSTSYARKLASDSATALQVNNLHIWPTTHSEWAFFTVQKDV